MKNTMDILKAAKEAAASLGVLSTERKNRALLAMADALERATEEILLANQKDVENATHLSPVMVDRLRLDEKRIFAMAHGIREVAALPDPVGKVLEESTRPNGLKITKKSVPLGVIGIIYESRPNVTSDAGALCFKSGNVCVLRGGKDAFHSSFAILQAMKKALAQEGLSPECMQIVEDTSRESATQLMGAVGYIDALIPRGGAGLIRACVENAKVPCIQTGTGICHIYVDEHADLDKALAILENAKTSRPSVCNAAEVCLVHSAVAKAFLPLAYARLTERAQAVELRCDERAFSILEGGRYTTKASEKDFDTEFLDYILAVKIVDSTDEAIEHIRRHSTGHSECIVSENDDAQAQFALCVDSAAVYVNASTRFTDGGEFGMGCEIGISTQKLHARGPMGLQELCSYKYIVQGNGQTR